MKYIEGKLLKQRKNDMKKPWQICYPRWIALNGCHHKNSRNISTDHRYSMNSFHQLFVCLQLTAMIKSALTTRPSFAERGPVIVSAIGQPNLRFWAIHPEPLVR